jgi:hypothetical protein
MKWCLLMMFVLAGWASSSCAQTTQPAPAAWDQSVQAFAKSLVTGDDCKAGLTGDCAIRSFDSTASRQIADVTAHASGATLLMAHAYLFPGGAIAGDIGAAVADSQVPDDVKKRLVPPVGDPTAKANATATRWVQSALAAGDGEPIAVLVLFTGDLTQSTTSDGQILFIMLKGRKDSTGAYFISQIVYGDSQQAAVVSAR